MTKIYTDEELIEGERKFDEAEESIDYDNLDLDTMSFDEFKELVTKGIYVEDLIEMISEFIDKCKNEGKSVLETLDEFEKIDFESELKEKREHEEPLTHDSLKNIMKDVLKEKL